MKRFFFRSDGRLRVVCRLLLFAVIFGVVTTALMYLVRAALCGIPQLFTQHLVALALGATIAVYLARRFIDKRDMTSLGIMRVGAVSDVVVGTLISVAMMIAFVLVSWMLGYARLVGYSWWNPDRALSDSFTSVSAWALFGIFVTLCAVAWWEELVMRGYLIANVADAWGIKVAVIADCAIFGIAHAFNSNASILSITIIAITTIQLIYAYLKSRALWLPVGIHLGWNFTQGSIFGFGDSGASQPSLLIFEPVGPDWLSGGQFGPEGSVFLVPLTAATLVVIYWWCKRSAAVNERPDLVAMWVDETIPADEHGQSIAG